MKLKNKIRKKKKIKDSKSKRERRKKTRKKKIKSKSKRERRKKTRKRMKGGATAVQGGVAAVQGMFKKVLGKRKPEVRDHKISTRTPPRKVGKKDASQKYIPTIEFSENESEHLLALYGRLDAVLRGFRSDSLEVNGINIYIKYKNGIVKNNKIIVMKTP